LGIPDIFGIFLV